MQRFLERHLLGLLKRLAWEPHENRELLHQTSQLEGNPEPRASARCQDDPRKDSGRAVGSLGETALNRSQRLWHPRRSSDSEIARNNLTLNPTKL